MFLKRSNILTLQSAINTYVVYDSDTLADIQLHTCALLQNLVPKPQKMLSCLPLPECDDTEADR